MKKNSTTNFLKKLRSSSRVQGMTFIELIVVMSLFTIFASLTLFQFSTFSGSVSIQTLSQDIALKLVQAQKFGSSGAYPNLINPATQGLFIPADWTPTHGVHFYVATGAIPGSSDFQYFFDGTQGGLLDINRNNKFDASALNDCSGADECLDNIIINGGDHIMGLCVETSVASCVVDSMGRFASGTTIENLDIMFSRPNLSAKISAYTGTGVPILPANILSAKISVASANGSHKKIITVYPVGQITVE